MKKFWIIIGAIAFVLIVGTTILLCCIPKTAPQNDNNGPAIEIPVDPETPPELPDDNPTDKDDEENKKPADVIPPKPPKEDEKPKEDEIVGTIIPFSFKDGAFTGCTATNNEITIPTSYSIGGYKTEEKTFENIWDFYEWYHNQQFEWKGKEITIQLANGEDYVIYNSSNILPELENIDDAFPIIYKEKKEIFVEGNDFQVTSIAENAFAETSVEKVIVPEGITHIGTCAFSSSNIKEIELPESLISIGYSCFSNSALESLVLPTQITQVPNGLCNACSNLKSIEFKGKITAICDSAFWGCVSLEQITIPDTVTRIEFAAFHVCETLKEIDVPEGVDYYLPCVAGCDSLQRIIYRPNIVLDIGYDKDYLLNAEVYVPDNLVEQYKEQYPELNILAISEL